MFKVIKNKDIDKILEAAREKRGYIQQIKININGQLFMTKNIKQDIEETFFSVLKK